MTHSIVFIWALHRISPQATHAAPRGILSHTFPLSLSTSPSHRAGSQPAAARGTTRYEACPCVVGYDYTP